MGEWVEHTKEVGTRPVMVADSDLMGEDGRVTGKCPCPDCDTLLFSLSSLQWPCGVSHTGEQPIGVEGGATASATVSEGEGWDRMGHETHSILGSEDKPKESTVFPVPTGT